MPVRKPPQAKNKDLASQAEKIIAGKQSLSTSQMLLVASGIVAVVAVIGGVGFMLRSKVVPLAPSDTAALKQVFYSGEPWLVECTAKGKASAVVYDAESSLGAVNMGTLDCEALLPSGKSTYDRFKLKKPSYGPTLLSAANTERPQIVPRNVLSSGAELAKWVMGATRAKIYNPTPGAQFDTQCVKKELCLLAITATGRLNDAEKKSLQAIAEMERRVRVVKVDASKNQLLLDLPGGAYPQPTASQATLLLLREKSAADGNVAAAAAATGGESSDDAGGVPVIATHLSGGLVDPSSTAAAIRTALTSDEAVPPGFEQLVRRPSLRAKRLPPPPQATSTSSPSTPDPKSKTYTDAELKAIRAEREKALKEAELQRRAKMAEEEASAANIVEEVDGNAAGSATPTPLEEEDDDAPTASADDDEVEAEEFD